MSGIEVVGLVLGILPLFISALEHYEEGLTHVAAMFKYRRELARYRSTLMVQYALYSQTVEYLLTPIMDEDELESMISQGFGEVWKDADLAEKLEEHLGSVYEAYKFTLMDIQDVIEELATMLDIERTGHLAAPELEALLIAHPPKMNLTKGTKSFITLYDFKTRLKFSLKSGKVRPLLERLESYNSKLERFTESSNKLEKARARTKASRKQTAVFAVPLHDVQRSAQRLCQVLEDAWDCARHDDHSISLRLESRLATSDTNHHKQSDRNTICFSMSFPSSCSVPTWKYLEMHVLPDPPVYSPKDPSCGPNGRSKVGFVTPVESLPTVNLSSLSNVPSLCAALESLEATGSCLGFCVDHHERLLGNYPVSRNVQEKTNVEFDSMVTLNELLAAPQTGSNKRRKVFTCKQAYIIALTVASAFLQLHSTPFTNNGWCADDIVFFRKEAHAQHVDVEKPHVARTYSLIDKSQAIHTDDHCALLNLGILLLEIYFKEPLCQHQEPGDNGADQTLANFMACRSWLKEDKENLPAAFYQAISYCIGCFANPDVDLKDAGFRQQIVDQVIIPIRDEMKLWPA